MLKTSDIVELAEGWNFYTVVEACEKYAKLKCTTFYEPEDLGDQIMCSRQDQEIWIAQFHSHKFSKITAL